MATGSWPTLLDVASRLAPDGKKLELLLYAAVRQDSGEDWTGVALVLSTAQPDRSGTPPEPS